MSKLTKDQAVSFGGKIWAKDGKELRVYLNADAVLKMVDGAQVLKHEIDALKKAKTFVDIETGELKSDTGTVRVLLNQNGFVCSK